MASHRQVEHLKLKKSISRSTQPASYLKLKAAYKSLFFMQADDDDDRNSYPWMVP